MIARRCSTASDERVGVDLDAGGVAVVPDPHLLEAEPVQRRLGPIDPAEDVDRHLGAVRDPAGEARRGRLVPCAQPHPARGLADVGLREAGCDEREHRARLLGGLLAGPVVAEIVDVDAEHHGCVRRRGDRADDVHQLRLAVEAAVGVVDAIRSALHLVGHHRRPGETPFGCERPAVRLLVAGERRRHGGDGQDAAGAQRAVGDGGEERRIGAAAEGDDDVAQATQFALEIGDPRLDRPVGPRPDPLSRAVCRLRSRARVECGTATARPPASSLEKWRHDSRVYAESATSSVSTA